MAPTIRSHLTHDNHRPHDRAAHPDAPAPGQCPRYDPPACLLRRHQDPGRRSTFRAAGITAHLENGGSLENAAAMANHASTRTTQLYDRRRDEMSLDEVERISI